MPHSLVMIPVPELDDVVRALLGRLSPELVPADPDESVAHVPLLGRFLGLDGLTDGILDELEAYFCDVTPFAFRLTGLHRFPGGADYLSPEPARPFRQLTTGLVRRFPEHTPSGGSLDEVVPHLSVPFSHDQEEGALRTLLADRLPITAHAREACVYWSAAGDSRTLATFEFGTSAA